MRKATDCGTYEVRHPSRKSSVSLRLLGFLLLGLLAIGSDCGVGRRITDATTDAVNVLDEAVDALRNTSADWQQVLQDAQQKLTEEAQATVRNEIANIASRSIAQAGVEMRCNVDFVRARISQALLRIKARLLGSPVPSLEPALCQVVPIAVDRAAVPEHVKQLEFYGYDLDVSPQLQVYHEATSGARTDVTSRLDRPTHYAMTLKFGATGVQLDEHSERFVVQLGDRTLSTVAVIQPATPLCQSKVQPVDLQSITFVPPKQGSGDGEFDGHGPDVSTSVELSFQPKSLDMRIWMRAKETKSDWTLAEGSIDRQVFVPPPGWRIDSMVGQTVSTHSYRDSNHEKDSFDLGSGGPVKRLVYVGDTDGNDAGTRTRVDVAFNRLALELVQDTNCVSDRAVMALRAINAISSTEFHRLEGRAASEGQRRRRELEVIVPHR